MKEEGALKSRSTCIKKKSVWIKKKKAWAFDEEV
jgi:hypothetical protein